MGYMYSEGLQRLGRIDDDGYVYDEGLHRIGRIDFDSGYIYAENLSRIGRIDKSGYIYDEGLRRRGHIDENGYVYDEGLRRIGRIDEDCVHKIFGAEGPKPGCFLTSACVEAMGLPDDCYELNILRSFRDNYLKSMPSGSAEIEAYYQISPRIVAEIHKKDNAFTILSSLYENLVRPCVKMIENGDYSDAYGLYKATICGLEREYVNS
ncbi:MAG: hypothetical protein IKG89_04435 [Oscillospiraceae bacterium]|nr:hypothetical protein [Oscillospiraceae bacterium]